MLKYVNHDIYQSLTAAALVASVYLIAAIPSALFVGKPKPSAISIIIIFLSFWISNPALGETFFWFVGASNYLWPIFYISLFFVILARQRKSHTLLSYSGAILVGFWQVAQTKTRVLLQRY
jgi:ABC-type spermidine/putrescine transport system permease subunit I